MGSYSDFYRRSVDEAEGFWAEQARLIETFQSLRTLSTSSRLSWRQTLCTP